MQTDRSLVLRINELFHDLEGEAYTRQHAEIFKRECMRWQRLLQQFFPASAHARTILDIGAGTGFVGTMLRASLKENDTLICADISEMMLQVSQKNLRDLPSRLELLKMHGETLKLLDSSVDIVTMNALLHHVPDPPALIAEIIRVLKPKGLLFIGHEPSNRFFRSRTLTMVASALHHAAPKRLGALLLKQVGLYERMIQKEGTSDDLPCSKISATLMAEGRITRPLSMQELSAYIDIHSPTAGGLHPERGFDPVHLLDAWNRSLRVQWLETYGFLPKYKGGNLFVDLYNFLLRRLLPLDGITFFLIAEKQ